MIVVIEGADLTGKTTLVKELNKKIKNSIIISYTGIPSEIKNEKIGHYIKYVDSQVLNIIKQLPEKTVIFDRFMLSEIIYSKYFRRLPAYNLKEIIDQNFLTIILYSKEKTLKNRYNLRKDDYLRINEVIEINKMYYKLYSDNLVYMTNYFLFENENMKDLEFILRNIIKKLKT